MRLDKCLLVASALALAPLSAATAQTLRIAMTTSDVPTTGGIPDNGSEGGRFAGYPIFDALVNWDFTKTDELADLTPGLASEWHIDPEAHERTVRRAAGFTAAGVVYIASKPKMVLNDRAEVTATLRAAYAQARARPRPSLRATRARG